MHYTQAMYMNLGPAALVSLLVRYQFEGKPLAGLVNPTPVGIFGNLLAFVAKGVFKTHSSVKHEKEIADWMEKRGLAFDDSSSTTTYIPLPTHGIAVEGVLGRSNTAEKIDLTRFWNWQDAPPVVYPTEIGNVSLGDHAREMNLSAGAGPTATLQQMPATILPNPSMNFTQAATNSFSSMMPFLTTAMAGTNQLAGLGISETQAGSANAANTAAQHHQINAELQARMAEAAVNALSVLSGNPSAASISAQGGRHNLQQKAPQRNAGASVQGMFAPQPSNASVHQASAGPAPAQPQHTATKQMPHQISHNSKPTQQPISVFNDSDSSAAPSTSLDCTDIGHAKAGVSNMLKHNSDAVGYGITVGIEAAKAAMLRRGRGRGKWKKFAPFVIGAGAGIATYAGTNESNYRAGAEDNRNACNNVPSTSLQSSAPANSEAAADRHDLATIPTPKPNQ